MSGHKASGSVLSALLAVTLGAAQPSADRVEQLRELVRHGDYAEAETGARDYLKEVEAVSGADSPEAASVLDVVVEALWRAGKAREPETTALAERSLTIREKKLGPEDPAVAKSLTALAILTYSKGDYAAARLLFERSLAIREKAFGPEHGEVGGALSDLAVLLNTMGDYAAARRASERALTIVEKQQGPESAFAAKVLINLANSLNGLEDYIGARAAYERILTIYEKTLGPEHPEAAMALSNLGQLYQEMGEYVGARASLERALSIKEKALGTEHPSVARTLIGLADLLSACGEYTDAKSLYQRALAIDEKTLGLDHPYVAMDLASLAGLLESMGDLATARALEERALTVFESVFGPDHPHVAQCLDCLASVVWRSGEPAEARRLRERALAIQEKADGPESRDVARILTNLAGDLAAEGDREAAAAMFGRALSIKEKTLGPEHPSLAFTLVDLARVQQDSGDLAGARKSLERAVSIRQTALGPDHPELADALRGMARNRALEGDLGGAAANAIEAERIKREHIRLTGRGLPESQALQYLAARRSGLDDVLSLAAAGLDPGSRRAVLDVLVRSRAIVLDELAARHRVSWRSSDPRIAQLAAALASARTRLANLAVRGKGDQTPETYRSLMEGARAEKEQAERALASASSRFAEELSRAQIGFEQVHASMPPGSALVAFAIYSRVNFASTAVVPSYLAFVLRAGDVEPRVVDLGPADVLDASVATWKRNVASPGPESSYREAGIALRRLVWDPLQEAVGDAKRLFIVPDGALQLVNLAALPGDAGVYLVETAPLIHYLSSERDLVPLKGRVAGQGLLAVGAPQYDATGPFASLRYGATPPMVASKAVFRGKRAACGDIASARFEPLPQTGKETEGIVRLWEAHGNGAAVHLRQAEATETALKLSAPGHRVLHLATHGFFLGEECSAFEPARGVGGLVGASKVAVPPALAQGRGESPLLLSGLVLAGANHRNVARDDEDDGILTAEEIASLDLTRVEWAVLSACDTGVGEVRTGEGVFGMRRAFQIAGARTLILSLWSVEDDATRAWMAALYTARLQEGLDTAASVRAASLRVLETRKARKKSTHPFYWAAFVAAGGWE